MRYPDTHKDETRRAVVRAASAAVRAKGPDGVSVAEVMAKAGLTHGGFYAHFPSKQALVEAAIDEAFDASSRRFAALTEGLAPSDALAAFVDNYVTPEHRARPDRGCPIATLASELPRQGAGVRRAYERGVKRMVARVAAWLPECGPDREGVAASLVAEMAGAVLLSRATVDDEAAALGLADARRRIKARMGICS